jgi:uncharacterized protein YhjY with autotransporter beta-barrel domain
MGKRRHRPRGQLPVAAGMALLAGAAFGVPASARAACVPTSQVVSTAIAGPVVADGGGIAITPSGSVAQGVVAQDCGATGIANAGSIAATPGESSGEALRNAATIGSVTNDGTIAATRGALATPNSGDSVGLRNLGSLGALANPGMIRGDAGSVLGFGGDGIGVANGGRLDSLDNAGLIQGLGGRGVWNGGDGFGLTNAGTIGVLFNRGGIDGTGGGSGLTSGGRGVGLFSEGEIGSLRNEGSFRGTGGSGGVYGKDARGLQSNGRIGMLFNGGIVAGTGGAGGADGRGGAGYGLTNADLAVSNGQRQIGTLTNAGSIAGTGGPGGFLGGDGLGLVNGDTIGALDNGGSIVGRGGAVAGSGNIGSSGGPGFGLITRGPIGSLTNQGSVLGLGGAGGSLGGEGTGLLVARVAESICGRFSCGELRQTGQIPILSNSGDIVGQGGAGMGGLVGPAGGAGHGLRVQGEVGTLANTGRIAGTGGAGGGAGYGILVDVLERPVFCGRGGCTLVKFPGSIAVLENAGLIAGTGGAAGAGSGVGAGYGLYNRATIGEIRNAGTITGTTYAIYSEGGLGPVANAGVIAGNITIRGQDAVFRGGDSGATGVLRDGRLDVPDGNLTFAGGRMLLAQDIAARGGAGLVTNAATLMLEAPQRIAGSFRLEPAGALGLPVAPGTPAALGVSGSAVLAGGQVLPLPGWATPPALGDRFAALLAEGGLSGSLSYVAQPASLAPGTRLDALYGTTLLSLVVTPAGFADLTAFGVTTTPVAAAVGHGLDGGRPLPGVRLVGAASDIFSPLYALPPALIPAALEPMAPVVYADSLLLGVGAWRLAAATVGREIEARRGAPSASFTDMAQGASRLTLWAAGTGQAQRLGAGDGWPGFTGSAAGVVAGVDGIAGPGLTLGVAVGLASQWATASAGSKYAGQAAQLVGYGSWRAGAAFVDGQVGLALTEGTARRPVAFYATQAGGDPRATGVGGSLRAGVTLPLGGFVVEPSLALDALTMRQAAFTEDHGGVAAMAMGGAAFDSLQSVLAVRVDRRVALGAGQAMIGSVRLGWAHEMADTVARVPASFAALHGSRFTVQSAPVGRDSAVVSARATWETGARLALFAAYDGAFASGATTQAVTAGLRWTW